MDKLEIRRALYQEACNAMRQQETMLFQRLNYFLVAIAFLLTAFVQLVTRELIALALLVGTAGVLLSWLYTAINYHAAGILKLVRDRALVSEKRLLYTGDLDSSALVHNDLESEIFESGEHEFNICTILVKCIRASAKFSFNKKDDKEKIVTPHTLLIPYYFIAFWLTALTVYIYFYLQPKWGICFPLVALGYVLHPLLARLAMILWRKTMAIMRRIACR